MRSWPKRLWQSRSRTALVGFGLFLVFVPTAFGVFVEWTEWWWLWRGAVLVAWGLAAVFVVRSSVVQGEQVEDLLGTTRKRRDDSRDLAAKRLLGALLRWGTGLPDHYLFRVFVYDEDTDRLVISYEPEGRAASSTTWEPGQGATGAAWQRRLYVRAEGESVADATFGLTPEQQERYRHLKVIAAMPVLDERGNVIAILTGSSDVDGSDLASPDGEKKHEELAIIVGRVLIDLVGTETESP